VPTEWQVLLPESRGAATELTDGLTFSIVIAAYQAEDTIGQAIESALAQTSVPHEVIVCDDGSTDGTADVARSYEPAVRLLVRPENGGEAAAKNTATQQATGDFVVILDADDIFGPRRLEALEWLARSRPDLDVLVTNADVKVGETIVGTAYHEGWPFEYSNQRREILRRNFVLGNAAIRRQRWLDIGGFDESVRLTTDWDFFIRLLRAGSSVGLVNVPLAEYRLHAGSLSSDRIALVQSRIDTLERARARGGLSHNDLDVLGTALSAQRRELLVRKARASLEEASDDRSRRHLVAIARDKGFRRSRRAAALAAAAAPTLAGLWLRTRDRHLLELGTGVSLNR
jgi:glycosyltransferase involved in cell wall biosynthesis